VWGYWELIRTEITADMPLGYSMKARSNIPRRTNTSPSARQGTPGTTEFLAAVFKNLAVGVMVCDSDGHFLFFSPEAERILGIGAMHAGSAAWSATYGCYRPDMVTPYPPKELPLARAMRGEEALHELIFIRNP